MITGKDEKYILKTKMSGEVTNLHFMVDVYKIIYIFSPGWRQTSILYWEKIWTNILHPIKLILWENYEIIKCDIHIDMNI